MKLRLGIRHSYRSGDYGTGPEKYDLTDETLFEFMNRMMQRRNQAQELKGLISTLVTPTTWIKASTHVLAADLDGEDAYDVGTKCLRQSGIDYAVIESTLGRYWVFCDKIGTFKQNHEYLSKMPGVDVKWLECCDQHQHFMFRAFPKVPGYPLFRGAPLSTSTKAGEWFYQFRAYFTSYEYISLHDKIFENVLVGIPWDCRICDLTGQNGVFCKKCGNPRNHAQSVARRYQEAKPMFDKLETDRASCSREDRYSCY